MNTLRSGYVTIRKPHTCGGCGNVFPTKTKMYTQTNAGEGTVWTLYLCFVCDDYWTKNQKEIEEFNLYELFEDTKHYLRHKQSISSIEQETK